MAKITEILRKITTAVHGKDVRGSLRDGLDAVNKEVEDNTDLTKRTQFEQEVLDKKYKEQIAGATDITEIKDFHVSGVTGKVYRTMGERADDSDRQLAQTDAEVRMHNRKIKTIWIDPVEDFGAKAEGLNGADDTVALQAAIDFAATQLRNTDKKIGIDIGNRSYSFTGLVVPRGISIRGTGTLFLKGVGNTGLRLENALYCMITDVKIELTEIEQTAIDIDSVPGSAASQLNEIFNIAIEGNYLKDTRGVRFGYTWVNNMYGCKIFRCGNGVEYADKETNACLLYGCEIRHENSHPNSKLALFHRDGKNNGMIGGVVENYRSCIEVRNGDFTMQKVYTEAFAVDRGFVLFGDATLTLDSCLIKSKCEIRGGSMLRIINCQMKRGGVHTNNNSPFIRFIADVDTKVVMENNNVANDFVHARWGMWMDISQSTWKERSAQNKHEKYLDRYGIYQGTIPERLNITGDGTEYEINLGSTGIYSNPYGELSPSGTFTPIDNGLYKVNITVRLEGISDANANCVLYVKETGAGARVFSLDVKHANARDWNNRILLSGEAIIPVQNLLSLRFSVLVNGGARNISIGTGPNDRSIYNFYSIQRLA